jgi:CheY-like chemotaxis protein
MDGDEEKCLEAGCTAYATKPINRELLIGKIKEICRDSLTSFALQ